MIDVKTIEKLAALARVAISDKEKEKFGRDLDSILNYVSELRQAPAADGTGEKPYVKNVLREDAEPYPAGTFSEAILKEAPTRVDNYFKVKKIFN